jgi:hypothetical protein
MLWGVMNSDILSEIGRRISHRATRRMLFISHRSMEQALVADINNDVWNEYVKILVLKHMLRKSIGSIFLVVQLNIDILTSMSRILRIPIALHLDQKITDVVRYARANVHNQNALVLRALFGEDRQVPREIELCCGIGIDSMCDTASRAYAEIISQ